jgi:hypothetical protein
MIVVVAKHSNFKKWGAIRSGKVGRWLPKQKAFEKAINVFDEKSLVRALSYSTLLELIILDKVRTLDLSILRRKVEICKLLAR